MGTGEWKARLLAVPGVAALVWLVVTAFRDGWARAYPEAAPPSARRLPALQ